MIVDERVEKGNTNEAQQQPRCNQVAAMAERQPRKGVGKPHSCSVQTSLGTWIY